MRGSGPVPANAGARSVRNDVEDPLPCPLPQAGEGVERLAVDKRESRGSLSTRGSRGARCRRGGLGGLAVGAGSQPMIDTPIAVIVTYRANFPIAM